MAHIDDAKRIHLIGIGGCSMNGLALILKSQGHEVTGSDRLLDVAVRLAEHLLATFGPGRDERVDDHPEVVACCRHGRGPAEIRPAQD